ncbi:MAG: 2-C-methyl-D-erythritol 4-phosphate cytidylyltransferase [Chitinivibrionales bacterium]
MRKNSKKRRHPDLATNVSAVIVAGGRGERLGMNAPKAFVPLNGKPLFSYSLEVFDSHPEITDIHVVIPEGFHEKTLGYLDGISLNKNVMVITGGAERWISVCNGVQSVDPGDEWVMVHDAARPFVTRKIIDDLLALRSEFKAVITATPVNDTLRTFRKNYCLKTVNRENYLRVGTPQLFSRSALLTCFESVERLSEIPTDEAAIMEQAGYRIGFAWGDTMNYKITSQSDLAVAEALLAFRDKYGKE